MAKVLNKEQVIDRYSKGYLKDLEDNNWVQGYLKTKKDWHESYHGLWLPDLAHLWRLVEVHSQHKVTLTKKETENIYVAESGEDQFSGECPEEAMLRLFIYFQSPSLAEKKK